MGELILIIILLAVLAVGAAAGFGIVKFFLGRTAAFIAAALAFLGALGFGAGGFVVGALGGLALAVDALNRDNPGMFIILGGLLMLLGAVFLLGASIGGIIAAIMKKTPPVGN